MIVILNVTLSCDTHTPTHLFGDPHVEVVEVRVAAIRLPAVLAAILVASDHGDGVQCVRLAVVVANPCSTPESRETSVSYPAPGNTSTKREWVDERVDGWMDGSRKKKNKGRGKERRSVPGFSVEGRIKEGMQHRGSVAER